MSLIRGYAIHAIDEDANDAAPSPQDGRRAFDYAALLRRVRVRARDAQAMRSSTPSGSGMPSSTDGTQAPAAFMASIDHGQSMHSALATEEDGDKRSSSRRERSLAENTSSAPIDSQALSPAQSLTQHLQRHEPPYLDALSREQQTVFVLLDYLTARVADFCTDPAVLAQGYWTMRLRLDPAILPDCTLALTLSYFDLTLRFEARDATARQLVLHHADVLKQRLEALLEQHDAPRTVEILTD
jgi:type III secretion control protein HpaP